MRKEKERRAARTKRERGLEGVKEKEQYKEKWGGRQEREAREGEQGTEGRKGREKNKEEKERKCGQCKKGKGRIEGGR